MNDRLAGIDANELDWRESHRAMVEHFGHTDEATQPAPLLELVPMERPAWGGLSARAENKRAQEAAAIAADLAYQQRKNSGQLMRREIDRAHSIELNERTTNNLGLWG